MRLFGLVSWYDEQPEWLAACVASLSKAGVSHIVAVDGAYQAYPGGVEHPRSGQEQHAAILEVAHSLDMGCTLHVPDQAWIGNEIEKRSFCFALAEQLTTPYEDWYFVMDADQVVTTTQHLPETLCDVEEDVAETLFWERNRLHDPTYAPLRNLFRAIPGLRVKHNHYTYMTPDGRRLWGDWAAGLEPAFLTTTEIEHRTWIRPRARMEAQQSYYERRDRFGIEHATVEA